MQPVLTTAQSRAFDKYLIEEIGIPSLVLMENAAHGALAAMEDWIDELVDPRIAIFCGPGNNGGDGLALAKLLNERDIVPKIFLATDSTKLSGDARSQYELLMKIYEGEVFTIGDDGMMILEILGPSTDILVDALLGTGSHGRPRGAILTAIRAIDRLREDGTTKLLAIDIPSGLDTDNGAYDLIHAHPENVFADRTITMGSPKVGFYMGESKLQTGEVRIASLGAPYTSNLFGDDPPIYLIEKEDAVDTIPTFPTWATKVSRGRVLALCGSRGMTGAAIMSGSAALKSGCGLVVVALPESERAIVAQAVPELLTLGLKSETVGSPDYPAWEELGGQIKQADVVLVGCGLPVILGTTALALKIIAEVDKPMVIDAGALGALVGHLDILKNRKSPTILTPHIAELARLVDRPWKEVERERLDVARKIASEYGVIVVAKGAPTYTIDKDGTAYINSTGNAGLATAGTGDVLAGMIASILAQNVQNNSGHNGACDAAMAAVYLHGLAGDFAAKEKTMHGMTASDVITMLPASFKELQIS
jgi:NAD(P)H-hydrate epimerase